ncbi:MAG: hypothetical protein U0838_09665 [Chloroflexota bacterium]
MEKMSGYAFVAALLSTILATGLYAAYAISGLRAARMQTAGMPTTTGALSFVSGPRTAAIGRYATWLGWLATAFLLAGLVFRAIATGHGPFANMYEFSLAFAFGVMLAYMYFEHKYHQRILALVALPVALAMMAYASTIPPTIEPLRPRAAEQPPPHRPRRCRDRRLRLLRHRLRGVDALPAPDQ